MPEHDAFGRPIGEDPLAALRGATEPDVAAEREPEPARPAEPPPAAVEPRPAEPPPRPAVAAPWRDEPPPAAVEPRPVFVRRRRRGRGIVPLLLLAIVIVGAVPAVVGVVAEDVRDGIEDVLPPVAVDVAAPEPVGFEPRSLIRRGNFAEAIATLRGADLGRPANLRVAPERIDAMLVTGSGRVSQVQVRFDGELQRFSSTETGASPPSIPFDRIDPAAPERLVRGGARRTNRAARRIDYLVLGTGPGLPWGAYFKGGTIVQGDARGRPRRVL